jgi:hypothetical protein
MKGRKRPLKQIGDPVVTHAMSSCELTLQFDDQGERRLGPVLRRRVVLSESELAGTPAP